MQSPSSPPIRIAVLLVAGCAVLVAGSKALAREPTVSAATNLRIAFASNRNGDSEIYTMKPDGTAVTRLTRSPKIDLPCQWSRDGSHLLFYSQRSPGGDVWVMASDGSGQRNLTRSPAHDSCGTSSPDGTQIVFDSTRKGAGGIYVMNADGSGVRRLGLAGYGPAWKP